jgi:NAD(P)-dependent dehydrogenase (short-subunit alcohol dehydrogenase family)
MRDILGYEGRISVVTGCASGMGRATAQLLLELGAQVHGLDIQPCDLALASFNAVDLQDPQSIETVTGRLPASIDALFNCAGLGPSFSPLEVMKVNFIGTRDLAEKLIPRIARGGAVASIASTAGIGWRKRLAEVKEIIATRNYAEALAWTQNHLASLREGYSFSKEAIIVWTLMQSQLYFDREIRINCTVPSTTQTPMLTNQLAPLASAETQKTWVQPMGRPATAAEQAFPLVMVNSPMASYVNGVAWNVDGGRIAAAEEI